MASEEAEKLADEIVSYLFDDYPDNDQVRGDAIVEIANRITTALIAARAEQREKDAQIVEAHPSSDMGEEFLIDRLASAIRAGKE